MQQIRFSHMVDDLCDEVPVWITADNIEQKINSSLFRTPSTTGLVTKSSQHWRYYALIYDFSTAEMLDGPIERDAIDGPNMKYYRATKKDERKDPHRWLVVFVVSLAKP